MFLGHLRNMLENEGIRCEILRDHLLGTIGGLPPVECWAELWVLDDSQLDQARYIVEKSMEGAQEGTDDAWTCGGCGEEVEAQFMECWKCGFGKYG